MQFKSGINKFELDTPALLIDRQKLMANLHSMQKFCTQHKLALRPHAKTHKCSTIARLQLAVGSVGICVAKVSEALVMAKAGISGILITSPLVTAAKMAVLLEVLQLAPDSMLVVDNWANIRQLDALMGQHKQELRVILDIDGGIGRSGVQLKDALSLVLKLKQLANLHFSGLQCYAGHIQHIADFSERAKESRRILTAVGRLRQQLIELGIACPIQTGSGSGTFSIDADIPGVSEVQPGSYCVMDQEYHNIEYPEQLFSSALSLLCSVISTNHASHVTVDVGTKAMYQVATLPAIISHPGLVYDWSGFGDEHGKVTAPEGGELPPSGAVLELTVAHCDPTINLFDRFYITENDRVVDCWPIDLRGCCQ